MKTSYKIILVGLSILILGWTITAFDAVDYAVNLLYIASDGSDVLQMQENARVFGEKMDLLGCLHCFHTRCSFMVTIFGAGFESEI